VIRQENRTIDTVNEFRYKIDEDKLTDNNLTVPYAYYEGLADEQSVTAISLEVNGQTVIQTEYRNFVTYYDYEMEKNEAKREIKIIKKEYYPQIIREFESLTNVSPPAFFRRVS
jgi:chloramphenicol O-acetyltransferase